MEGLILAFLLYFFPVVFLSSASPISDTQIGTVVGQLNANDVDLESRLEYSISPASEFYHVDRFSGTIFLAKSVDYETQREHVLNVEVYIAYRAGFHVLNLCINFNRKFFVSSVQLERRVIKIKILSEFILRDLGVNC